MENRWQPKLCIHVSGLAFCRRALFLLPLIQGGRFGRKGALVLACLSCSHLAEKRCEMAQQMMFVRQGTVLTVAYD